MVQIFIWHRQFFYYLLTKCWYHQFYHQCYISFVLKGKKYRFMWFNEEWNRKNNEKLNHHNILFELYVINATSAKSRIITNWINVQQTLGWKSAQIETWNVYNFCCIISTDYIILIILKDISKTDAPFYFSTEMCYLFQNRMLI